MPALGVLLRILDMDTLVVDSLEKATEEEAFINNALSAEDCVETFQDILVVSQDSAPLTAGKVASPPTTIRKSSRNTSKASMMKRAMQLKASKQLGGIISNKCTRSLLLPRGLIY